MSINDAPSSFARLKDLAAEPSSEKRRELLRDVTDMFLADDSRNESECMLFDEVVSAVARDMEVAVRAQLADKIADANAPVSKTAKRLAMDDIEVARPILERSTLLSEDDLVEIVQSQSQDHLMAVTKRDDVSERISTELVDRGADEVVASLLNNSSAIIGRESMEKVVDRAQESKVLQTAVVKRDEVPLDLLNDLVMSVENSLRAQIMSRFENVSPQELELALSRGRRAVKKSYGKVSRERQAAQEEIDRLEQRRALKLPALLALLQNKNPIAFAEALGRLSGIGYDAAIKIYKTNDIDALAMVMKALDADLPLFATIAAYLDGTENAVNQVKRFGGIYKDVPAEAAQRALRFWKVRAQADAA